MRLISQFATHFWSSQKRVFSLLNENGESANGDEKAPKAENVDGAPCQDSRVYSISWTIREDDRVPFVG